MYKWDKKLLYRAVDLQLEAVRNGVDIDFGFPRVSSDKVQIWDYRNPPDKLYTAHTNEELEEMLEKIKRKMNDAPAV